MTDTPSPPSWAPSTAASTDLNLISPATTMTPPEAAARLQELSADKAWSERLTRGDAAARREFEQLTERAQVGDVAPEIETVDAVSDLHALPRAAYSGLIDGLREQGLPETAEQYMRDIDAGRRTDRPTAGDGLACQQALNRLTADAGWR